MNKADNICKDRRLLESLVRRYGKRDVIRYIRESASGFPVQDMFKHAIKSLGAMPMFSVLHGVSGMDCAKYVYDKLAAIEEETYNELVGGSTDQDTYFTFAMANAALASLDGQEDLDRACAVSTSRYRVFPEIHLLDDAFRGVTVDHEGFEKNGAYKYWYANDEFDTFYGDSVGVGSAMRMKFKDYVIGVKGSGECRFIEKYVREFFGITIHRIGLDDYVFWGNELSYGNNNVPYSGDFDFDSY